MLSSSLAAFAQLTAISGQAAGGSKDAKNVGPRRKDEGSQG